MSKRKPTRWEREVGGELADWHRILRSEPDGISHAEWCLLEPTIAINGGRGRGTEGKVEIRTRDGALVEVLELLEWNRIHEECLA